MRITRIGRRSGRRALLVVAMVFGLSAVVPLAPAGSVTVFGPIVSIGDASIHEGTEGNRSLKLAVTLSAPSDAEVVVSYVVGGGTATQGVDYKDFKGDTKLLRFKPSARTGLTPTTKFIGVPLVSDTEDESDESVDVTITDVTTDYSIGDDVGVGTIIDDDPGSGLLMALGDATAYEGDAGTKNKVQLWVTLTAPASTDIAFDVTITGGSATIDEDYDAKPVKSVVVKAGKWKKPITVTVLPDLDVESDETIEITLSTADPSVTITDGVGQATILDDDTIEL